MAWLSKFSVVLLTTLATAAPAKSPAVKARVLPSSEKPIAYEQGKIEVAGHPVTVEIARTNEQHERGLMFRRTLKDGDGMLFIFQNSDVRNFWMKNTFVDLDIAFFDEGRRLINVESLKGVASVMEKPETAMTKGPASYVLEVPRGWFARKKIPKDAFLKIK